MQDATGTAVGRHDAASVDFARDAGLQPGWRCLAVGDGAERLAGLLADAVGPGGDALAAGLDELPREAGAGHDLVLARLVTEAPHERPALLRALAGLLRPGGWLAVEAFDNVTAWVCHPPSPVHERVVRAIYQLLGTGGPEAMGRPLVADLLAVGLTDVTAEASVDGVIADRDAGVPQWGVLLRELTPALLARRLVTEAELDAFTRLLHDGRTTVYGPTLLRARGRCG